MGSIEYIIDTFTLVRKHVLHHITELGRVISYFYYPTNRWITLSWNSQLWISQAWVYLRLEHANKYWIFIWYSYVLIRLLDMTCFVTLLYVHVCQDLGWGLLKLRSLISPFREILISQNCRFNTHNHVHICQVSPQLSCGDTCQIWTWYRIGNCCFITLKNFENNGTAEIGLVTPTPDLNPDLIIVI